MAEPAIIGVSELLGADVPPETGLVELVGLAGRAAMLDAELVPADVDAVLVAPTLAGASMTAAAKMAEYLGIAASVASTVDLGGASAAGMAWRAVDLVAAGRARTVLCLLGEVIDRSDPYTGSTGWSGDPRAAVDRPYGYPDPNAGYALAAMRHAHEYGTTTAQRARIVVDQRRNASNIVHTAARAFAEAEMRPGDMDVLEVYDCYTITVLLALEDAGFCAKGTAGPFVAEHDLTWTGDLPVNTNGGQLNTGQAGYAGGATHLVQAVRQLRGDAAHQVPGCARAFVHGNGGTLTHECSLVLAREDS